jgi:translation initiation factor eIF-2B subunit gamma
LGRDEEDIEYIGLSYPKTTTQTKSSSLPRIVFLESKLEVEADEDMTGSTAKLELPKPRLHKGKLVIGTEWNDVHVYSLAPWVRQLLVARKSLSSVQSDLLPLLVSRQFRGKKATFGSSLEENDDGEEGKENAAQAIRVGEEPFAVSALVLENKTVLRINTIPAYLFACKETVANGSELPMPEDSRWNGKFVSLVLKDSTLGAKVTMKSSIVGASCQLGSKCRLNNVVIMDNVTIGENCSLQNTILGSGVVLGNNCSLNDCQVGPGKALPMGTKEKGESFMVGEDIAAAAEML